MVIACSQCSLQAQAAKLIQDEWRMYRHYLALVQEGTSPAQPRLNLGYISAISRLFLGYLGYILRAAQEDTSPSAMLRDVHQASRATLKIAEI